MKRSNDEVCAAQVPTATLPPRQHSFRGGGHAALPLPLCCVVVLSISHPRRVSVLAHADGQTRRFAGAGREPGVQLNGQTRGAVRACWRGKAAMGRPALLTAAAGCSASFVWAYGGPEQCFWAEITLVRNPYRQSAGLWTTPACTVRHIAPAPLKSPTHHCRVFGPSSLHARHCHLLAPRHCLQSPLISVL